MSSDPLIAKERTPSKYNAMLAINEQFIHIMKQWDPYMQVTMDDAQRKRRGANKSFGRQGGNRLFMDNWLTHFDLMVGWKITECVRTRLLPDNKFCADGWHPL